MSNFKIETKILHTNMLKFVPCALKIAQKLIFDSNVSYNSVAALYEALARFSIVFLSDLTTSSTLSPYI